MDFLDQIQIRIFKIHNLSVFVGKVLKKIYIFDNFPNKNGKQQMPYMYEMYNILTEPMLVVAP